jgi:two-component system, response regulator
MARLEFGLRIVMAEDDEDDRLLAEEAFQEARLGVELDFVGDGVELLDYLKRRGAHAAKADLPLPAIILLDLNMPKLDGRETLEALKADPALREIQVVVLTTSKAEVDIFRTYDLGANSFITKPVTFRGLVNVMRTLASRWPEVSLLAELPPAPEEGGDAST